eukprot:1159785-Pelagomonas_calceolata.AAC.2
MEGEASTRRARMYSTCARGACLHLESEEWCAGEVAYAMTKAAEWYAGEVAYAMTREDAYA